MENTRLKAMAWYDSMSYTEKVALIVFYINKPINQTTNADIEAAYISLHS